MKSSLTETLQERAKLIGLDSIRATTAAGSGHPTSCLSIAEILSVLFFHTMQYDPANPHDENNDRLILSKGHAAPALYAVWKQRGVITDQELLSFRTYDSVLEGHPTPRWPYHEAATGSLGQGLAVGVGIALAHKKNKKSACTYVILGDGECAEGSVWEAASLASHYRLNKLIAVLDVNRLGQTGATAFEHDLITFEKRFEAFGWKVFVVDGHDVTVLLEVFDSAKNIVDQPSIIIAKTFKGHGYQGIENNEQMHGKPFTKKEEITFLVEERAKALEYLVMPKIESKLSLLKHPEIVFDFLKTNEYTSATKSDKESTRKAAGLALAALGQVEDAIVACDADVKNSTYFSYFSEKFPSRFVQCFVAEQAMVNIASGFALRNKIPFAGTFSAFLTRAADQIRMAGIGKTALRIVGSHAGISIGQDGPSQMGLEDIALFRTIPDAIILYPSDAHAAFACIVLMANYHQGVSYLRATRAETEHLYDQKETFEIGGSKLLKSSEHDQALIVAAGITVHEALKAAKMLEQKNITVSIIDAYSVKPLDATTIVAQAKKSNNRIIIVEDHYQAGGIGEAVIANTAEHGFTYDHLCVKTYARSASPEILMEKMGIDATAIVRSVTAMIKKS
jgi:transketolase